MEKITETKADYIAYKDMEKRLLVEGNDGWTVSKMEPMAVGKDALVTFTRKVEPTQEQVIKFLEAEVAALKLQLHKLSPAGQLEDRIRQKDGRNAIAQGLLKAGQIT